MTGWQIAVAIYLAAGVAIAWALIPGAESERVRGHRGTVAWWLGGLVAGLVCVVAWLPIAIWGMLGRDDG